MPSSEPMIRQISDGIVKPKLSHPRRRCHLSGWDLSMLSAQYIQKGLLFSNALHSMTTDDVIERLKTSLSAVLVHFYPLAGRFLTEDACDADGKKTGIYVSIDCDGQGAQFVHAAAENVTVVDVLSPSSDVPSFVRSFFLYDLVPNHEGHWKPLLGIKFTELADGFFVGCSFNHAVGDGTSYWNFFNAWAEIARSAGASGLSRPPGIDRWFIDGYEGPPIKLPYIRSEEFVQVFTPPPLRERIFHFSAKSIALLKAKVNKELGGTSISSFQSVAALLWRSIMRARNMPADQVTNCRFAIENRSRLQPRLSPDYFGNSIYPIYTTTTVGELLSHGLGWAAWRIHQAVTGHTDGAIRKAVKSWMEAPKVYSMSIFDAFSVMMGSSPRFNVYECEFGWGKAVASRSGIAHKFDGKVTLYPGWEGGGSMDLEICLLPENMATLESDGEFMATVSPPVELEVLLHKCQ